jgi:polar amino acid transport system permease protein
MGFYWSFVTVLTLIAITAPCAGFGFGGRHGLAQSFLPLRWLGKVYIWMVRGVPDIVFFLFFVIALDQGIEYCAPALCPDWTTPGPAGA